MVARPFGATSGLAAENSLGAIISVENNEYLQFIHDQLMDVKVRVEFIEHAIEENPQKERNLSTVQLGYKADNIIVAALVVAPVLFWWRSVCCSE